MYDVKSKILTFFLLKVLTFYIKMRYDITNEKGIEWFIAIYDSCMD